MKLNGKLVRRHGVELARNSLIAMSTVLLLSSGCASVKKEVAHFDPVPREEVGAVDLEPVTPEGGDRLRLANSHSDCFSNLDIPYPLPQPVLDEIDELQNSYPKTFQRGLNRSTKYMPYLKEEFRKAGLPEDLAWLAMVESMFQPKVVSHAGAGGMWQFMRATGRRYNLRMDSYVDERYNWHSSTRAAIEYLKALHDFFDGEWALAVTAYNMGEGGLDRAIKANNGDRDFFELIKTPPASDRMKEESKKYYPRLVAYIIASKDPAKYGFDLEPESFEDVLRIPVEGMYHLTDLDNALGLPRGTLAQINPDLLREATPPQGKYLVAVPREAQEKFLAAIKTVKSVRYAGTHRVKRGETVSQIARKYGVSDKELMRMNNIRSANSLQANQTLQLPGTAMATGGNAPENAPEPETTVVAEVSERQPVEASRTTPSKTYKVKRGDTLYDIAHAHKVNIADLQTWNNLRSASQIRVGQTLNIGTAKALPSKEPIRQHIVKPGEYPGIIAQLYGISVDNLLAWNNLGKSSVIQAGDKLVVSGETSSSATDTVQTASAEQGNNAAPSGDIKHKVAKGETPGGIASRYGVSTQDLLSWNKLTAKSILRVGQNLTVRNPAKGAEQRDQGGDMQMAQAQTNNQVVHKVTAGQNPTIIAKKYGVRVSDLFKWNKWTNKHVLRVGDKVAIYRD